MRDEDTSVPKTAEIVWNCFFCFLPCEKSTEQPPVQNFCAEMIYVNKFFSVKLCVNVELTKKTEHEWKCNFAVSAKSLAGGGNMKNIEQICTWGA